MGKVALTDAEIAANAKIAKVENCKSEDLIMAEMTIKVPSIVCKGCAETITKEILTHESGAKVDVDIDAKTVSVQTEASPESIKQMITSVGHTVE